MSPSRQAHIWKDKEVCTVGDLINAIAALESREEAQEFIAGYRAVNQYADVNAGYVTGYLEDSERLREWMGTPHPVFGMKSPSPEEAFAAGKALMEAWMEGNCDKP